MWRAVTRVPRSLRGACVVVVLAWACAPASGEAPPAPYEVWLVDHPPRAPTMWQVNATYLSLYRGLGHALDEVRSAPLGQMIWVAVNGLVFYPITHEEGHRSVLTGAGIGAVSEPWFHRDGTARVTGVRDEELQRLRDRDLPTYIRLHTAGLESDGALAAHAASLAAWEQDDADLLWPEVVLRRGGIMVYHASGLFRWSPDLREEADELDSDVVGHDVYGAVRHLHRPTMPFRRYTDYEDLTFEERRFVRRVGWRTWLNLASPMLWGRANWTLDSGRRWSGDLSYSLTPFGDMIEHAQWWARPGQWGARVSLRAYQNEVHWFPGVGLEWCDLRPMVRCASRVALHGWQQPKDLRFRTAHGEWGGAVEAGVRWRVTDTKSAPTGYILLGALVKTKGYQPEAPELDASFGVRGGFAFRF